MTINLRGGGANLKSRETGMGSWAPKKYISE